MTTEGMGEENDKGLRMKTGGGQEVTTRRRWIGGEDDGGTWSGDREH